MVRVVSVYRTGTTRLFIVAGSRPMSIIRLGANHPAIQRADGPPVVAEIVLPAIGHAGLLAVPGLGVKRLVDHPDATRAARASICCGSGQSSHSHIVQRNPVSGCGLSRT